ncbi:MAG: hypothetical protein IIZ78_16150, partial [Clostridiales bacterium]|nr:hypothetical protein [Clostridiales bacterium]
VHFVLCVMGPDGIEVQYPYGWISAEKLASIESAVDRMEYIVGFSEILEDQVIINGDTVVPRAEIEDAKFSTDNSIEIYDFSNGKEYFTDKNFMKILEWCDYYEEKMGNDDQERDSD